MNFNNRNNQSNLKDHKNNERLIPFITGFALGIPFGRGRGYQYPQPMMPYPYPIYPNYYYPRPYPRRYY